MRPSRVERLRSQYEHLLWDVSVAVVNSLSGDDVAGGFAMAVRCVEFEFEGLYHGTVEAWTPEFWQKVVNTSSRDLAYVADRARAIMKNGVTVDDLVEHAVARTSRLRQSLSKRTTNDQ